MLIAVIANPEEVKLTLTRLRTGKYDASLLPTKVPENDVDARRGVRHENRSTPFGFTPTRSEIFKRALGGLVKFLKDIRSVYPEKRTYFVIECTRD